MFADWLLLNCSGGIQQTLPLVQLVFLFLSMVFAGDYGLPVAYFLEAFRGTSKVNVHDDLKHYPLYKKTWSHNVVFQTEMYVLFILVIFVEQIHVCCQYSEHSGSDSMAHPFGVPVLKASVYKINSTIPAVDVSTFDSKVQ